MKILSFDVGIKNLAYCILEYDDKKKYKIIDWKILNLISEKYHTCGSILKKKKSTKVCGKKASFIGYAGNGKYRYYCGVHSCDHSSVEANVDSIMQKNTVMTEKTKCCHTSKNGIPCKKPSTKSYCKNQYCETHLASVIKKKKEPFICQKIKKFNANKEKIEEVTKHLYVLLRNIPLMDDVNMVLIENQPTPLNPTMKVLSSVLMAYFVHKSIDNPKIQKVAFLSPINKLKIGETVKKKVPEKEKILIENEIKKVKAAPKKEKYANNKRMGILYTNYLLECDTDYEKNDEWKILLDSSKKKDDLCDSFLQAHYYYSNMK